MLLLSEHQARVSHAASPVCVQFRFHHIWCHFEHFMGTAQKIPVWHFL